MKPINSIPVPKQDDTHTQYKEEKKEITNESDQST